MIDRHNWVADKIKASAGTNFTKLTLGSTFALFFQLEYQVGTAKGHNRLKKLVLKFGPGQGFWSREVLVSWLWSTVNGHNGSKHEETRSQTIRIRNLSI